MGRQLALDSAEGKPIANEQGDEISPFELACGADIERRFGANLHHLAARAEPSSRYNCHGLAFASRRTAIFESSVVTEILREDGYSEVEREAVLPGDTLIYFDAASGEAEHSAIVIDPPRQANLFVPLVVSKWGKHREFVHGANNCPYTFFGHKYYRISHG